MIGIIFNPNGGGGKSIPRMEAFLKMLDSKGIEYDYRPTQKAGDAIEFAKELGETCDTVVAAGGDGTMFEVVNTLWEKDVRFALLPYGSGNDLASSIYGNKCPDERIVDCLVGNNDKMVDCATINDQYVSPLVVATGLGADIVKVKADGGSYMKALPKLLFRPNVGKYTLIIDGKERHVESELIISVNTGIAGGGMHICSYSEMDDGQMEVLILGTSSKLRRLRNMIALATKKLEKQPNVEIIRFKEMTIKLEKPSYINIDGEIFELEEINMKVLKQKLRFAYFP